MDNLTEHYVEKLKRVLAVMDEQDIEMAVARFRKEMENLGFSLSPDKEKILLDAARIVREEMESRVDLTKASVLASHGRIPWYKGSPEGAFMLDAYLEWLSRRWGDDAVESIRESSRLVMSRLANPADKDSFPCKGLVVGHVQSGKTANMMAVIARAVDAGYNMIIVLAGMTDTLRHQTQERINRDLVERYKGNWFPLTRSNKYDNKGNIIIKGDYTGLPGERLPSVNPSEKVLAVIKKNRAPLDKLLNDVRRTPRSVLEKYRVLIIDDEADQASINSSGEDEMTAINERIRRLIHSLPHVSFVGYTATPFANMLINPFPGNCHDREECLDDLYPKDFIVALPAPDGYFGAERLFGRDAADLEDAGDDGLDFIRTIPDTDKNMLLPKRVKDKDSFLPVVPESLEHALLYFLAACADRHCRGDGDKHMSMLVHTSHLTILHEKTKAILEEWLENVRSSIRAGDKKVLLEMREIWNRERQSVPDDMKPESCNSFEELEPYLPVIADRLGIVMENSLSDERLNFSGEPRPWIVIGGNILARGLTIEGLMTSYFLRASRQYDTLLQMGRWFGYRHGYEDLQRIWMTEAVRENFRKLAVVEHEIREEIEDYAAKDATPMDFAVRIRVFPGLAVTARNKMRHAVTADIDYSGRHLQTIRFPRLDYSTLEENWKAASRLLTGLHEAGAKIVADGEKGIYWEGASLEEILAFLNAYKWDERFKDMQDGWVVRYIEQNSELLASWHVAVVQPQKAPEGHVPLGPIQAPRLVNRARLKGTSEDLADIKALMSRTDLLIDCPEATPPEADNWSAFKDVRADLVGHVPLLLLYPVNRYSVPRQGSKTRLPMDAVHDILGVGILFPAAGQTITGKTIRVHVDLSREELDADDVDTIDEEESSM